MDVEEEKKDAGSEKKDKEGAGEKKEATDAKKDEEKKEEKKPDPTFDVLNNPARVMKPQLQVKRDTSGSSQTLILQVPFWRLS